MEGKKKQLLLLLLSSLFLNVVVFSSSYYIFFFPKRSGPHELMGWARMASEEAEAVAATSCSGHGNVYLDSVHEDGVGPRCECNTCYSGAACSEFSTDCSANADGGDPLYLEPYWKRHAASSAVVLSGWHRMSYKATGDNFISLELERHIRLLHKAVKNAVTDRRFILFGTGSTQLVNALVYALSPDVSSSSSPAKVVASAPYYPMYQMQTNLFDLREYQWEGSTSDWVNASDGKFIEFVTSPNNPDCQLRRPVLGGSSVINDNCYYWPHYSAITAPANEEVMLFTISKISGHASSRFGWAVIKDEKVYKKVVAYMQVNSMGVSRDSQLRILKIIKAILAEMEGGEDLFEFGYNTMKERWQSLNNLVSQSRRYSLQELPPLYCAYFQKIRDPSPAYGWLKCEMEDDQDCEAVLRAAGIITRSGVTFHADSRYTRLSLIKTQDDFDQLMSKLEDLIHKERLSSS